MRKIIYIILSCPGLPGFTPGRDLNQIIWGTPSDTDTDMPLIGLSVVVPGTDPSIDTTTDINDAFKPDNISTGRITLQKSYPGYETKIIPRILPDSSNMKFLLFFSNYKTRKYGTK